MAHEITEDFLLFFLPFNGLFWDLLLLKKAHHCCSIG
jgi:hypothetical protein